MSDWHRLSPLPRVAAWNKGKRAPTWQERAEACSALDKRPLIVTAEMASPIIHAENDRTHLDGLLSFAALTAHPVASQYDGAAVLPLPLELLWVSPEGLPLWAATPLMAATPAQSSKEYWHKRYPSHRADMSKKQSADTKTGRWKEYRVPLHAQSTERLHALCIGHAGEIEALLSLVTHIGKKGGMGYGRVARWHVTPGEHGAADILARRLVPVAYDPEGASGGIVSPLRGWTPPYWYMPWWAPCVSP